MTAATLHYQGHTYEIRLDPQSWTEANQTAAANGGYLACISSSAENTAVFQWARAHYDAASEIFIAPDGGDGAYVWIGGTDSAREGTWLWSDGAPLSGYSNWGSGSGVVEPDNFDGIQDHMGLSLNGWPQPDSAIGAGGEWNDIWGVNGLWSVVEWDGLIGTAAADRISGSGLDESFFGGDGADVLLGMGGRDRMDGSLGADRLSGGGGSDVLNGGADSDTLQGDDGSDRITGGTGVDRLSGGVGSDVFLFDDGHSGLRGARDLILDFRAGADDLNLRAIDADTGRRGDQEFSLADRAAAHSVWLARGDGFGSLRGDVDGDGMYDFEIRLNGVGALTIDDIIL